MLFSVWALEQACDSEGRAVSVMNPICAPSFEPQWSAAPVAEPQWYAVHTRSQHEKSSSICLSGEESRRFSR